MNQTVLIILLIVLIILGVWQYCGIAKLKTGVIKLKTENEQLNLVSIMVYEDSSKAIQFLKDQRKVIRKLNLSISEHEVKEGKLKLQVTKFEGIIQEKDVRILELEIKLDNKEQMIFMLNEELKRLMGEEHGETE